jgi:cytochrome c-type biogenesis protein CcmH/NrfF
VRRVPVASFLASGILTWAIPLLVLLLVGIVWAYLVRRHPEEF